jgi:hypothetical protein
MIPNSQGGEGLRVEMKECHKSPVSSTKFVDISDG